MKSKGLRPQQRNELKKLPEWMKQQRQQFLQDIFEPTNSSE